MALTQVDQGMLGTNAQYTGFKNRIINGAMVIDQRNAGASVTPTNGQYTLDRWSMYTNLTSKISIQQLSASPPTGFVNYLGATVIATATLGASDHFSIRQYIEGFNTSDFAWGTANAKSATLSFWVYSNLTGTFGGSLSNNGSTCYPFSYSIPTANTWTQISITVTGPTSGTFNTNNTCGILLCLSAGTGTTYSGTAGAWGSTFYMSATGATSIMGTVSNYLYITGVQLEVGTQATSFDYRPYGTELALCERYYWKSTVGTYNGIGAGSVTGSSQVSIYIKYPTTMRAAPTLSYSGTVFYQACSDLYDSIVNARIVHAGQQTLVDSMNNCAAKESDAGWRITRSTPLTL